MRIISSARDFKGLARKRTAGDGIVGGAEDNTVLTVQLTGG
jgi:hypothetical protein